MAEQLSSFALACLRDDEKQRKKVNGKNAANDFSLILSSAAFVASFDPPEYVIEGILQRRFIYSFTGQTGAGKTALMLLIAAHVALGRKLGGDDVEKGTVLYLAGENPVDIRMRWIAMAQQHDFDADEIGVHFISGTFKISELVKRLHAEVEAIGGITLVLIDTSSAYFEGLDENDNRQAGDHARLLRNLTDLPGGPCVVVACHPPKNAGAANLQPRGGGAFIAEMDGSLTAQNNDGTAELHWQGKFRGPDFAPISFEMRTVTHELLKDSKGRLLPTVVARHVSETAREDIAKANDANEIEMLRLIDKHPKASLSDLANMLGWKMRDGQPYKMRAKRVADSLTKQKLVKRRHSRLVLMEEGKKVLAELNE